MVGESPRIRVDQLYTLNISKSFNFFENVFLTLFYFISKQYVLLFFIVIVFIFNFISKSIIVIYKDQFSAK